jgi:bifunctional non-homologous end joining protein LigD
MTSASRSFAECLYAGGNNPVLTPMLATAADVLPTGSGWTYEIKWDGYRALAAKEGSSVRLISRNQKNLTADYPAVVNAVQSIKEQTVLLDGEIVALDANGRPSFQALQHRSTKGLVLAYVAFDVLTVGHRSLVAEPLSVRRTHLRSLLSGSGVMQSDPLPGSPEDIERAIRDFGLEGVVAKRDNSPYRPGQRSDAWVKVKFSPRQEFVVGGYKMNGRILDSLVVGYYESRRLLFAAQVRNGFTPHLRTELRQRLEPLKVTKCPFVNLPNSEGRKHWGSGITAEDMSTFQWVKPREIVDVAFVEWTLDSVLRHPRFIGFRSDKRPTDVHREGRAVRSVPL